MKKAFLFNNYHFKNQEFLNKYVKKNFTLTNTLNDADVVFSPSTYIDIENYPNKKFIFGNHFSVFPNSTVRRFNNIHNNAIYIQPSQQSVDTWQKEFNFTNLPMKTIQFAINTEKFKPSISNDEKDDTVMVYYKDRNPEEFKYIITFLNSKKINYRIFSYTQRYKEEDFINYLKKTKYAIWLGSHESQGFALLETLSTNVPILVWNVTLRKQQWSYRERYKNIQSKVTSIPYWDSTCGEYFYNQNEFENKFNKFINNLDNYQPRQFILNNLTYNICEKKWNNLIEEI